MSESAAPNLERQKRRQAVQVAFFLVAVAIATAGLFHLVRPDVVAYRRGKVALADGNFAVAASNLETAWTQGLRKSYLQLDLADALWEAGRHDDAHTHYAEVLAETAPRNYPLLDRVVGLFQARGEPLKALALFTRLGPIEKLPVESLARLGDVQQQAGRYEDAIATYRLAVQRAPNEAEFRLRLGVMLSWTGRPREAAESLRTAVKLDPGRQLAQRYLGRVLIWDGRFAEAVDFLRRSLPE